MPSYKTIDEFLKAHACVGKNEITHTRIGDKELNVYPGKYNIPDVELPLFYKLYNKKVFIDKRLDFLTEVQKQNGAILIDVDFRYLPDIEERQHTTEHVEDLVELHLEELRKIIEIPKQSPFNVYVFEKPGVKLLDTKTKDGIHIVIGLEVSRQVQSFLRQKVLKKIGNILEELPLTNSYEDVLDEGIAKGHTNWQLFGSCKPGHDRYELTHNYTFVIDGEDELEWNEHEIQDSQMLTLLPSMGARAINLPKFNIKSNVEQELLKEKKVVPPKKTTTKKSSITLENNTLEDINSIEELKEITEAMIENLACEEYELKEIHQFTMCLTNEFYDSRDKWIRVGWALHNKSRKLFLTWMLFSSQSDKFDIADIPGYYDEWKTMKQDSTDFRTYTERSIMYWAKDANPTQYNKIKQQTVDHYVNRTLRGATEYDVALVLFHLFKDKYRCVSIKNKTWYEFIEGRWIEIDSGTTLRQKISRYLSPLYIEKSLNTTSSMTNQEDDVGEKQSMITKMCSKFSEIGMLLKKTAFKNNVMRECCDLFYEPQFLEKLDRNPYLLAFTNGVIDFREKTFRQGLPEDYLSLCTNIPYVKLVPEKHNKYMKEISAFMKQLFPIPELCGYMWDHLSSVLIGTNENQTFNIYTGSGSNGKSKLVELMELCLGDYKGSVPITLVTSKRNSIGSTSPEIAQLQGKRYAVMQEPSKGDAINEGIVKEITGGDPIQGRALYRDTVTFVPQFSLAVCTNNLFEVKSFDDGIWRRIRVCDFKSKFVVNPNPRPESPYEYKINKKLKDKFEAWKDIFISMLVSRAFINEGIVADCDVVMSTSNKYRESQDLIRSFCEERVVKDDTCGEPMKKTDIHEEFKNWYISLYGNKGMPKAADLYEHLNKTLGPCGKGKCKGGPGWKGYRLLHDYELEEE